MSSPMASTKSTPVLPAVDPDSVDPICGKEHSREVEKIAGEQREIQGSDPLGTVVKGIEDDRLWALLRRFDKQITHTLSPPHALPLGEPDLRRSPLPTVPFDSDLIRSNVERCYATVGISGIRFGREMQRLMSWSTEDRRRTAMFCTVYFLAWFYHLAIPLILGLVITLVVSPRSRSILFPYVPPPLGVAPSATDPTNQKGDESLVDSAHPQTHRSKSEQVEEQSWEFVKVVEKFGIRVLMGGRSQQPAHNVDSEANSENEETTRDEVLAEGGNLDEGNAKEAESAKAKRDDMIALYAKMMQDGLGDFADAFERGANALSPPAGYPRNQARIKMAGVLFAILVVTAVTPAAVFAQASSFIAGVGFFGQPLLIRAANAFVKYVPDWQERLDMRNSIFSQVPTDAQLTLHLLRQAELGSRPLPRAPITATSKHTKETLNDTSLIDEASEETGDTNSHSSVGDGDEAHMVGEGRDSESGGKTSAKVKNGLVKIGKKMAAKGALLRGAGKVAVLPEDEVKPKTNKKAKLADFLLDRDMLKDDGSIWVFPGRLYNKDGHIVIETDDYEPTISARVLFFPENTDTPSQSFLIEDVREVKKGGVKLPRSVLGWAAGMELAGTSLEVRIKKSTRDPNYVNGKEKSSYVEEKAVDQEDGEGEILRFESVAGRDHLFVRLISIGSQQWESL